MDQNGEKREGEIFGTRDSLKSETEVNIAAPGDTSTPIAASQGDTVLAWSQKDFPPVAEIPTLRRLLALVNDSAEAYEHASRESDELFRPIFLSRAKERREMANEISARILSYGAVLEDESDNTPGFSSSIQRALRGSGNLFSAVEEQEAALRSLFLTSIDEQNGGIQSFLSAQYVVIQRAEEELRHFRSEFGDASS